MERRCTGCKESKPLGCFGKDSSKADGTRTYCKDCMRDRLTAYTLSPRGKSRFLLGSMRKASKKRGFSLPEWTASEIEAVITDGKCAQTGIKFTFEKAAGERVGRSNPFAPSPDRIDPRIGYTKANVQWVCWMYNMMKTDASVEEVDAFISAIKASARL